MHCLGTKVREGVFSEIARHFTSKAGRIDAVSAPSARSIHFGAETTAFKRG